MGNSLPCPCPCPCMAEQHAGDRVLVMRADGSLVQFNKGIQAKEVAASHQGYRAVRCDSARTVLWGSAALDSSRLHFLMPEDKARCRETYEMYWSVGVSKGLVPARSRTRPAGSSGSVAAGRTIVLGALLQLSREGSGWTPTLRAIPEVLSPPPSSSESCSSSSTRSLKEQLASSPILFVS